MVESYKVCVVYTGGPTVGGRVALFDSEKDAKEYCTLKNEESKYSPTSKKDKDGVSLAWKMGDGYYFYQTEFLSLPPNYFEFD